MRPAMTTSEISLLTAFLTCSQDYVEFGAGGSSALAATVVARSILSIDSSRAWLDRVAAACASGVRTVPEPVPIDIGPIRDLGYPDGAAHRHLWANYHTGVWSDARLGNADLYLVDGRFRVACCLQTLLRCPASAIVLIHDFANRPEYHAILRFVRPLARSENLSAFQRDPSARPAEMYQCAAEFAFDPR